MLVLLHVDVERPIDTPLGVYLRHPPVVLIADRFKRGQSTATTNTTTHLCLVMVVLNRLWSRTLLAWSLRHANGSEETVHISGNRRSKFAENWAIHLLST